MSLQGFLVAFGAVFLAELPDKTMVASLVLTTRTRRPLAVWVGVSGAFVLHVVLAVSIGSLLRSLPEAPVKFAVAALFLEVFVLVLTMAADRHPLVVATADGNGTAGMALDAPLVDVLHAHRFFALVAIALRLLPYGLLEAAVSGVALAWAASALGGHRSEGPFTAAQGARAAALAQCSKLGYVLWLIWDMPRAVLPVVDCATLLWATAAAHTLAGAAAGPGMGALLAGGCTHAVVRTVFRLVTAWAPIACWLPLAGSSSAGHV